MKLNYKKQKLVESLGFNVNFKKRYGNKSQNVLVTPGQFKRLMESYLVYEEEIHKEEDELELAEYANSFQSELSDDILDEMNFGDDDMNNLQAGINTNTEDFNEEYGFEAIDHSDRSTYDGRKSRVVGVDSNIRNQRYESNEGKCLDEQCVVESLDKTFRMIRESIRRERPGTLRMGNYSRRTLNEQFYSEMEEQFYGGRGNYNNPGVNAAKGVEELVKNIKRAYNFIKDSKTKKQIHNTLVKLQNFMSITADAMMAGKQQRAPRRNDQLTRPLPYPELDEPEDLEDIDDELDLDSLNESRKYNLLREAKRELKRRTLVEELYLLNEQDAEDKIKELKDALKRERQAKRDLNKLGRKEKREERRKAREQRKELKKFEQLCSKFPDAPECSDKDEFVKDVEQEIEKVEVATKDVEKPVDSASGEESAKETSKLCQLKGDKTYEYKVENEEWYTRKKGTTKWNSLAGDRFALARARLDKGCPTFRKTKEKMPTDAVSSQEDEVSSATQTNDPDSWKSNIPGNNPERDAEARQRAREFARMGYTNYTGN